MLSGGAAAATLRSRTGGAHVQSGAVARDRCLLRSRAALARGCPAEIDTFARKRVDAPVLGQGNRGGRCDLPPWLFGDGLASDPCPEYRRRRPRRGTRAAGSLFWNESAEAAGDDVSDRRTLHAAADTEGQPVRRLVVVSHRVRGATR